MSEVETEKEEKTNSNSPTTTAKAEAKVVVEWTTWEELLLACAVKRHGLKDWDSVAMELQTRSFPPTTLLSPQICQDKFRDLKRRFTSTTTNTSEDVTAAEDHGGDDVTLPWLEDLRRLRVAELKQEVHRYDLSIESLQSKVKRLEEDRERSLKENEENNENDDVKTDLAKDKSTANSIKHEEDERSENDKREGGDEPADDAAGKSASGEEENRSFNESNSTNNKGTGSKAEPEPVKPDTKEEAKPVPAGEEDSCNDSSDRGKMSREKKVNSAELRDSVDESKEVTTAKESSDVQSSASLTRKKRRKGEGVGSGSGSGSGGKGRSSGGGGDAHTTTTTAAIKREGTVVKSEPLVGFLDIIRSHKHGSMFERRLDSQKSEKYKNLIRQHVDLQTIQTRIEDGSYTSCSNKFYLDLLLVFNNVIVYFPKSSLESLAAHTLRDLVMKEIKKKNRNASPSSSNPQPESGSTKVQQPKPDSDKLDSLLVKHKSTVPLVVCRKRSSIAAKASSSSGNKVEKPADNNKPISSSKPPIKASSSTQNEDDSPIKLKLKEKPVTGVRSMRRSSKGRPNNNAATTSNTNSNPNTSSSSQQQQEVQPVSAQKGEDSKPDKKKPELDNAAKKRGAADFLKRIKKNSPAKGSSVEASIGSPDDSKGGKSDNQKKKVVERKDTGPMRRSGNGSGKQAKEDNSPSKRNVGRPPKKGKEAPVGKRGRESGEGEGSSKRPNKRTRR